MGLRAGEWGERVVCRGHLGVDVGFVWGRFGANVGCMNVIV